MPRRFLSLAALALAMLGLAVRVRQINAPPAPVQLASRTIHLLYVDSLRRELLTFAEQYGRPIFQYDTTSPVTGHGRLQLARLREALFDPRIEYGFNDEGFYIDWRADAKPRPQTSFMTIGSHHTERLATAWPETAAEYARLRRLFITPQWPDPPARRQPNRRPPGGVPPHADAYSILALGPLP